MTQDPKLTINPWTGKPYVVPTPSVPTVPTPSVPAVPAPSVPTQSSDSEPKRPSAANRPYSPAVGNTPKSSPKLSDILRGNSAYFDNWHDVKPADEFGPVPAGTYQCMLEKGEPTASRVKQTPCVKLTFRITDGPFAGRLLWHEIWLTDAAKAQTKRDFDKLGIRDPKRQLEQPIPPGICCSLKVTKQVDDAGNEFNKVKNFVVTGINRPKPDPFAPPPDNNGLAEGEVA